MVSFVAYSPATTVRSGSGSGCDPAGLLARTYPGPVDTGRRLIPGPDHFGALLFFLLVAFLLSGRSDDVWPTVAGASVPTRCGWMPIAWKTSS